MHHLHVLADFLFTHSHRFRAFALQMRQQQLGCSVTRARVIPVHPPVDLRALLRVLRVHLLLAAVTITSPALYGMQQQHTT